MIVTAKPLRVDREDSQKQITTLRAELSAMYAKQNGLSLAIAQRRKKLDRLVAESVLVTQTAPVLVTHRCCG